MDSLRTVFPNSLQAAFTYLVEQASTDTAATAFRDIH